MGLVKKLQNKWWRMRVRLVAGNRLKCPKLRLHVPLRVDGKGMVTIGEDTSFGYCMAPCVGNGEVWLQARSENARIVIGNGCMFSNNISIVALQGVTLGDRCLVGDMVLIVDSDFHGIAPWSRGEPGICKPVVIGNNVWIGSRCIILKGVTIGDNSVVAAGTVVSQSIPPHTIVSNGPSLVMTDMSALWDRE